jgi:CHAT domain-containing protein
MQGYEAAAELLDDGIEIASELGDEFTWDIMLLNRVIAARELNDREALGELQPQLERRCAANPLLEGKWSDYKAGRASDAGARTEAEAHFKQAAQAYEKAGMIAEASWSWSLAARASEDWATGEQDAVTAMKRLLSLLAIVDTEPARLALMARLRHVGAFLATGYLAHDAPSKALEAVYQVKSGVFLRLLRGLARPSGLQPDGLSHLGLQASGSRQAALSPAAFRDATTAVDPEATDRARRRYRELTKLRGDFDETAIDPAQVMSRLRPRQVALEYFVPEADAEELFIFVLRSSGLEVVATSWSEQLGGQVKEAVDLMAQPARRDLADDEAVESARRMSVLLQKLHTVLVAPVGPYLQEAESLVVAPGEALGRLPFEALITPEQTFFGDLGPVSYVASTAQLALLPEQWHHTDRAVVLRGDDDLAGSRLVHADRELESIRRQMQRVGSELIPSDAFWHADIIHYGGHAIFDRDEAMAATLFVNGRRLQAVDFLEQRFERHPCVVLAGCETGEFDAQGDEFVGFARALFAAGASEVISSSWLADDESSSWLFERFYHYLLDEELRPSSALAEAKAEMRRQLPNPQWAHPVYWANFRCWGMN